MTDEARTTDEGRALTSCGSEVDAAVECSCATCDAARSGWVQPEGYCDCEDTWHREGEVCDRDAAGRVRSDVLPSTRAAEIAREAHAGQLDKIGKAYIGHPARIAKAVRAERYSDEVEAVAWLHDVVEDTAWTLDMLAAEGFSPAVIAAVDAISKRKGESFADYYERVKANPMALVVKWHDVADNADPERLALVAPDTRERLREKYERAKALLSAPARVQTPDGDA